MRTILTGGTGFLGKYIHYELSKNGEIITISRTGADINSNLAHEIPKLPKSDLVVHCAGKAHAVPKTDLDKQAFFNINLEGTKNLIKGIENANVFPKSFVFISSVAVYGCESGLMIDELRPLNASDPYGQSKIQAEKFVQNWCDANNIICSILRLPLLVGVDPPGNLCSMIKGIQKGYYFNIDGGKARKSMVLAEDVARIIPIVANIGGIYNLTDGYHPSFKELSICIAKQLNRNLPVNIPGWLAKLGATFGDILGHKFPINSKKLSKLITDLTFDDSKARSELNWKPNPILSGFILK